MHKIFIFSFLSFIFCAGAHALVDKNTASLRVMNKAAGRAHTIEIPVGETRNDDKLAITVRSCKRTDPYAAENDFAFVEITKSDKLIFSNWMNKNDLGANPVQDADWDIWLTACK
ncbi:MAG: DUF2155 domain-containing protein [Rickettsiales bacterium]|jgi:hypothetical protein|nr:DUF2155 domain-containing protein [Rickettsiales bacterium]